MIQELKITNFRSFMDETILSFEPAKDEPINRIITMPDGTKLLRLAIILGGNASGKSNFIKAFDFIRSFWTTAPVSNDFPTKIIPFLLDKTSRNAATKFELKFYVGKVRHWYKLEIDREKVISEILYVYESSQPTTIFSRTLKDGKSVIRFNPSVVKLKSTEVDAINVNCWRNMSLFSVLGRVNVSIEPIEKIVAWIKEGFLPLASRNSKISATTKDSLLKDDKFRDYLISFVKEADFSIDNVDIRDQMDVPYESEAIFSTKVLNGEEETIYYMPERLQSDGTTRMIELEGRIFSALKNGAFLPIDEIDASIHPMLLDFILNEFLKVDENEAQLLVTTHYDPLLAKIGDLFGKDSVWFTQKKDNGHSELYALTDFSGLNRLSSIHKAYLSGRFGATPKIYI